MRQKLEQRRTFIVIYLGVHQIPGLVSHKVLNKEAHVQGMPLWLCEDLLISSLLGLQVPAVHFFTFWHSRYLTTERERSPDTEIYANLCYFGIKQLKELRVLLGTTLT